MKVFKKAIEGVVYLVRATLSSKSLDVLLTGLVFAGIPLAVTILVPCFFPPTIITVPVVIVSALLTLVGFCITAWAVEES